MKSKPILAGILQRFTTLLLSSAVLCSGFVQSLACAGGDYGDAYYTLIPEIENSADPYAPYYLSGHSVFGRNDDPDPTIKTNMESWQTALNSTNTEAINQLIFQSSETDLLALTQAIKNGEEIPSIWKSNPIATQLKQLKKSPIIDYLSFAKRCEKHVNRRQKSYWEEEMPLDIPGMKALQEEGKKLLKKCRNQNIKYRYHYQLLRLHFFLGEYEEVGSYFAEHFSDMKWDNKLIFSASNYDFGAAYRLSQKKENPDIAEKAQVLLKLSRTFQNCDDCPILYFEDLHQFQAQDYFEAAKGVEDPQKQIDIWMLASLRSIPLHIALDKILALNPNAPEVESILGRMLHNSQRERFIKSEATTTDYFASEEWNQICFTLKKGSINKKADNRAQFSFLLAYFDYIGGKYHKAREELEASTVIPGSERPELKRQQRILRSLLDLEEWNSKKLERAHLLIGQLDEVRAIGHADLTEYTFRRLAELADQNGQMKLEKILFTSMFSDIETSLSYPEILMLEESYHNQHKGVIERWVWKNKTFGIDEVMEWKGDALLSMHRFEEAVASYELSGTSEPMLTDPFFIRLNDCHDCDHNEYRDLYTRHSFSKKMLFLNNDAKKGDAKAALLYANALYNITWFGNSRDALTYHPKSMGNYYDTYINNEVGNFYSMKMAIPAYQRALKLAKGKEEKAKILFLLAKCEQNEFDTDGNEVSYHSFYGDDIPCDPVKNQEYRQNFKLLKTQYANTEFYKMALKECSYFEHYVRAH